MASHLARLILLSAISLASAVGTCTSCPVELPDATPFSGGASGNTVTPAACPPGWCSAGTGGDNCATEYPKPFPEISDYATPGVSMACAGVHDPTHLIYAEGFLTVFGSGQNRRLADGSRCPVGIVQQYMAAESNVWTRRSTPMFGGDCTGGTDQTTSYPNVPLWMRRKASGSAGCATVNGAEVCDLLTCNVGFGGETLCDLDAPTVHYSATPRFPDKNGVARKWVMYYSAYILTPDLQALSASDSSGQACIGRATATGTPDALVWTDDDKPVYCSNVAYDANGYPSVARYARLSASDTPESLYVDAVDDGFAIDPELHYGDDGSTMYMTWGSGTINAVELGSDGHVVAAGQLTGSTQSDGNGGGLGPGKQDEDDTDVYPVISRGSGDGSGFNEAPYVFKYAHAGTTYYYLFVNWHSCCAAVCSKYEIMVGRSTSPDGGFVDRQGNSMDTLSTSASCSINGASSPCAGGTKIMVGDGRYVGPGHAGVLEYTSAASASLTRVFTFHYYDNFEDGAKTASGAPARGGAKLGAREMTFDAEGWPVISASPWDVCDITGCDGESVSNVCPQPIGGDGFSGAIGLGVGLGAGVLVVIALIALFFADRQGMLCKKSGTTTVVQGGATGTEQIDTTKA